MTNENQGNVDTEAAELVSSLLAVAPSAAFCMVKFDGEGKRKEVPLRIQLTRPEEDFGMLQRAQDTAKKYGEVDAKYGDIYREAQAVEVVAKVLRKPNLSPRPDGSQHYQQVFLTGAQVAASLTAQEIALVMNALEVTKAKFSCVEDFNPDEIDKWAARLSDIALGPFFLQRLDSSHWPALLTALALEVQALRAEVSRPLPSLHDSSESNAESSDPGTGGSSSSSTESLTDDKGNPIHAEHPLSAAEALEIARNRKP